MKTIGADKAFDVIKSELEDGMYKVILPTCDTDRHVEVIERMTTFVKERLGLVRLHIPYKRIPKTVCYRDCQLCHNTTQFYPKGRRRPPYPIAQGNNSWETILPTGTMHWPICTRNGGRE